MDGDKKGEIDDPDHLASSTENQNEVEFFPICLNTRSLPSNTVLQWQQVSDQLSFDWIRSDRIGLVFFLHLIW